MASCQVRRLQQSIRVRDGSQEAMAQHEDQGSGRVVLLFLLGLCSITSRVGYLIKGH